jgi:tRNA(Ile2) C34 agmatinyltransferase TiaS
VPITKKEKFIEKVIRIIDRWSFEKCAHCENGTLISIDGMVDFKCSKCGKSMNPSEYLGEIAKIVFDYRETRKNVRSMKEIDK